MAGLFDFQGKVDKMVLETIWRIIGDVSDERNRDESGLSLDCIIPGDDMEIGLLATAENGWLTISSVLGITVPEERQTEVLRAINALNCEVELGCFVLHPDKGMVTFEYVCPYQGNVPSDDFLRALLSFIITTVDRNDGDLDRIVWGEEGLHSRIGSMREDLGNPGPRRSARPPHPCRSCYGAGRGARCIYGQENGSHDTSRPSRMAS